MLGEKMKKKKIEKVLYRLNSINLESVEMENNTDLFNIIIKDSYKINEITDVTLNLEFSRSLRFEPKGLYKLVMKFEAVFNLVGDKNGDEFTDDYIKLNIKSLYEKTGISSYMVKAIADISSIGGAQPIVSPIEFIVD